MKVITQEKPVVSVISPIQCNYIYPNVRLEEGRPRVKSISMSVNYEIEYKENKFKINALCHRYYPDRLYEITGALVGSNVTEKVWVVDDNPMLILDCMHNADRTDLEKDVNSAMWAWRRTAHLLVGIMDDLLVDRVDVDRSMCSTPSGTFVVGPPNF